jgi:glycosyltransferase involved in cell wall biosynthesis
VLNVLTVAYPLAPVGPDAAGGAEQIVAALDRALVKAGHRSTVLACAGSSAMGRLIESGPLPDRMDEPPKRAAQRRHGALVRALLESEKFDVVHFHGVDVLNYLPEPGAPTAITIHLPAEWYPDELFRPRARTVLIAVSQAALRRFPPGSAETRVIANGVAPELFETRHAKRPFVLALGRICPEKGFHLALDAARLADLPLLLAGPVFPYPEHQAYFDSQIAPRLDRRRRYVGPVGFLRKRRLLAAARCLAMPTLVEETGAMAAMEALASATPVVAYPKGALRAIVAPGINGFLPEDVEEMAEAMLASSELDPARCRRDARRFDQKAMCSAYLNLYAELAAARAHAR